MIFHNFIFLILFIPIVTGINNTVSKNETITNKSDEVSPKTLLTVNNSVADFPIISEGGTIASPKPTVKLQKENNNTLLIERPDQEALLENSSKSKGTVARKGVHLEDVPGINKVGNSSEVKLNTTTLSSTPPKKQETVLINKLTKNTTVKTVISSTTHVPKPLQLSYEKLKNMPDGIPLSAKVPVSKQALNPGSHPGMVMPVVITVLVVPMFAVLGYLALKRGQEAWKNRHYKRMDFLLDGMYND